MLQGPLLLGWLFGCLFRRGWNWEIQCSPYPVRGKMHLAVGAGEAVQQALTCYTLLSLHPVLLLLLLLLPSAA